MTIRLEPELKTRLDKLASATHRSKSFLASEAVREYIELNEWQIQELEAATKEADDGDFADEQEVHSVFNKWGANAD
jgi:predicted transcriptional regulator